MDKKYYVYRWFTKTNPPMFFYVGKGTGNRYRHILKEIADLENDKLSKTTAHRVEKFKKLKDSYGIDYEIIKSSLTNEEALKYEYALKNELIKMGELIIDEENWVLTDDDSIEEYEKQIFFNHRPEPRIECKFTEHYFGLEPYFNDVDMTGLKRVWFYPYMFYDDAMSIDRREKISDFVKSNGGKILKTSSPNSSVIIQGVIEDDAYIKFREQKRKIYNANDIINFIRYKN